MAKKNVIYSFKKAYEKIPVGLAKEFRQKVVNIIGSNSIQSFYRIVDGWKNIPLPAYQEITELFAEYGIGIDEIWEITEEDV